MSYLTTNYLTAPTSPNPYVSRKLNNMKEARMMKEERNNWTKMYYKTLKGLEAMIDVQKQVRDMMKMAAETNTTIMEMEDIILKASTNNWVINATNITGVSEDLRYLIQSNMEDRVFQIQQILANELNTYKGKGEVYVEDNISVTNFIQLVPPQPVDRFSQTKLLWKAPNKGYPHICGMYKSNNKRLRYQAISSCKSFVC